MIEELTEVPEVREVKRLRDEPETHSVAVESEKSYRDPGLQMDAGIRSLPQSVLDMVNQSDRWQFAQIQFRTGGDYAGCFTIRIEER